MNRWRDFGAGMSAAVIILLVVSVVSSYGSHDSSPVGLRDIIWFLLLMAIFASSVIDVYNYWQRSKKKELTSIISLASPQAVEKFFELIGKLKK